MIHSIIYPLILGAFLPSSVNCTPTSMEVGTVQGLIEYHASIALHQVSEKASLCREEMDVFIIGGENIQASEAVLAVKDIVSYHLGEEAQLISTTDEDREDAIAVIFSPRK